MFWFTIRSMMVIALATGALWMISLGSPSPAAPAPAASAGARPPFSAAASSAFFAEVDMLRSRSRMYAS